ncbi:MAG: adenylate/guanylate cyclase domain-containing protein [Gordonia sp.]|nr:adenylate/guanylate cyclase domain-containing protein [Gordonia sp. (in: high G+C Gram-positive bacteria)]
MSKSSDDGDIARGSEQVRRGAGRVGHFLMRADGSEGLVRAARAARRVAPGARPDIDPERLRHSERIAGLIAQARGERPSAVRELALAAVESWQALVTRRRTDVPEVGGPVTILFTDLVGFSTWALGAGDDAVLELLRQVNESSTEIINRRGGSVTKHLGDGLMAVFRDGAVAIEAAHEAGVAVSAITIDGYRPALRAGLHTGEPRHVGDDYLGVDVNIAARVADAASAGEVLVTEATLAATDENKYIKRRRRFRAKGTPKDLVVYAVLPRYDDDLDPPTRPL